MDSDDDAEPPRRKRMDSDDDAEPPRKRADSDSDASPPRKRADSDSDASPPRKRADSDSDASPPRKRADSDSDASPPRKRALSDSNVSVDRGPQKSKKKSSSKGKKEPKARLTQMASGHSAGLQTGGEFKVREREIQRDKMKDMEGLENVGGTTYRDEYGRVVDQDEVERRQEEEARLEKIRVEREEREYRVGRKQKEDLERLRREATMVAREGFARRADDERVDRQRMEVEREGDPMKAFLNKQRAKKQDELRAMGVKVKSVYKGPPGKPNRYGIKPGYRWDGVVRGNGFEDRVLAKIAGRGREKEKAFKYSTSDMEGGGGEGEEEEGSRIRGKEEGLILFTNISIAFCVFRVFRRPSLSLSLSLFLSPPQAHVLFSKR